MSLIKRTIRLAYADATLREPLLRAVLDSYGEIKIAARPKEKTVHEPTSKQKREQAERAQAEQVGRQRAQKRQERQVEDERKRQEREEEDERKRKGEDLDVEANVGYVKKDDDWIKKNMFSFEGVRFDAGGEPFNFKMYLYSESTRVKEWDKQVGELEGNSDVPETHAAKDPHTKELNTISTIVKKAVKKENSPSKEWALGILIPFYKEYEDFILAELGKKSVEHRTRAFTAIADKDYQEIVAALDKIDWRISNSQIKEGIANVADALKKKMVRGQIIETANPFLKVISRTIETTCKAAEQGATQGAVVYAGINAVTSGSVDGMLSAAALTGAFGLAALAVSKTKPAEGENQSAVVAYLKDYLSPESFIGNLKWALSNSVMNQITGTVLAPVVGAVGAGWDWIAPSATEPSVEGLQALSTSDAIKSLIDAGVSIEPDGIDELPQEELENIFKGVFEVDDIDPDQFSRDEMIEMLTAEIDALPELETPEVSPEVSPEVTSDAAKMNEEVLVSLAQNAKRPITGAGLKELVKKANETLQNAVGNIIGEAWQNELMGLLQTKALETALDKIEQEALIDPKITKGIRKMFSSVLEQEDAKMSTSAVPAAVNEVYRTRLARLMGDLDSAVKVTVPREQRVLMRKVHQDLKKLAAVYVTEGNTRVKSSLGRSPTLKGVDMVKTQTTSLFGQAEDENQQRQVEQALQRAASTLKYAKLNEELGKLNEYQFGAVLFKLIRDTHYHASLTEFMEDHADEIAEAIKEASQGITEEKLKEAFKKAAKDMTAEGRVSDEDQIEELIENFKSSVEPDKKSIKKSSWKAELDIEF